MAQLRPAGEVRPVVIWLTGLSGSGKTTIARWAAERLRQDGHRVEQLDGDAIRRIFPNTGFTRAERDAHVKWAGYVASRLEHHGVSVVATFVSPFEEARRFVRGLCSNFVEVFLNPPLSICEERDVKGLYAKARRGEITQFTGIDDPYEPPSRPELTLDTSTLTVDQAGEQVLSLVRARAGRTAA